MLVEGIYLYLHVVKVYNINNKMTVYHVVSWGMFCKILDDILSQHQLQLDFLVYSREMFLFCLHGTLQVSLLSW